MAAENPVTKTDLHIAPGMHLPLDAVTQTIAIIARRGAGKTHTAVVLAEEMLFSHQQIVVLDPLGVWWGLRSSFDGKHKGFPVVVFGGDHGDVPLTEHMGPHVADVIVARTISAVIDLSTLSKSAARRFGTAFAERLYEAKGPQDKHTPLHLFIDEADLMMPQRVMHDQARMLAAFEMFPRRGRNRGFGVTVITQRPATLNKDVLTQAEVLITLQITGTQDRKAVLEWVEGHDDGEHAEEFLKSLAGLQRGQAWIWSPAWLNVFKLVQIRQRETFNSSATPTAGKVAQAPKELAPIDLEQLRTDMAATLKEAEANDPAKLKVRIRELEKHVAQKPVEKPAPTYDPTFAVARMRGTIDQKLRSWLKDTRRRLMTASQAHIDAEMAALDETLWLALASIDAMTLKEAKAGAPHPSTLQAIFPKPLTAYHNVRPAAEKAPTESIIFTPKLIGVAPLPKGERAILTALAQAGAPKSKAYVAITAGYAPGGGSFQTYLSRLRSAGLIEPALEGRIAITTTGLDELGPFKPLPDDRVSHWLGQLGKGQRTILEVLVRQYPKGISKAELGTMSGYEAGGGSFQTYLSRLRTRGLIEGVGGEIRAAAELMGDG